MSQAVRLFHICRSLDRGAAVTVASLQSELEVSRATVFRDITLLRDQLHAPIVWDTDAESFKLDRQVGANERFMVPGLWMDAHQIYGMLTVINIASAIDPGVAAPLHRDFRAMLKQMVHARGIVRYGIDEKIVVDIPPPGEAAREAMLVIGPALMLDQCVRLHGEALPQPDGLVVLPRRLRLKHDGWCLEGRGPSDAAEHVIRVADIQRAESLPAETDEEGRPERPQSPRSGHDFDFIYREDVTP